MPSISLPSQSFSVTAVNYSDLTVAANTGSSTVNLYAGLIGFVVGPGGTPASVRISIVAVESPGVIRVQIAPFQGTGGNTIQANFNAFNGGTLSFEAQLATVASIYLDSGQVASGDLGGNYPNPIVVSGSHIVPSTLPPATASSPGAVPNYPILPADAPALSTKTHAPRTQSANADTPALADEDGVAWMTYAGASTVTLPQDSVLAFTVGRAVAYKCANAAGKITFAAGSGATLVVSRIGCASLIPQNPWGTVYKSAANTWELIGPFVG